MLSRTTISAFFMLLWCAVLQANACDNPTLINGSYLHANNIRTLIPASGSLFWDGEDSQFRIEGPDGGFATIFTQGLWLGAEDSNGDLTLAIATFGAAAGNNDYYPGPVSEDGTVSFDVCGNYDRAWSVYRYQIEAHLADFQDNGVIDNPQSAILGWPGLGNAQFFATNGFDLPNSPQGFAPFFDINADGIYQPLQGEYPFVPQSAIVPDQIVWSVFNTVGNEPYESGSLVQMKAEIQLLAWAFNCTDSRVLSNSVFTSFKVINRGNDPYTNFRMGLYTDFDLGCFADDYIGSAPSLNTFYVYNKFPNDVNCDNIPNAGENAPVQAITVMSQPLDGFMYMNNSSFVPGNPGTDDPQTIAGYSNFLNNRFRDGTPLTQGGDGYNPNSTEVVNFAFPDNPNDAGGWSENSMDLGSFDRRALGNIDGPGLFSSGAVFTVDIAYSFHRTPGADNLGNVNEMYDGVAALQMMYDNSFAEMCNQVTVCNEDCIWAGDLNADGIANHEDILALGFGLTNSGNNRVGPYNWTPQGGDSWGFSQFNGVDAKHLDANGDGSCTLEDADKIFHHYHFTHPAYQPVVEYPLGDDITFVRSGANTSLENLSPGESFFGRIKLETGVDDLRGIAFTLEYDPLYFANFTTMNSGWLETQMKWLSPNGEFNGEVEYAFFLRDEEAYIEPQTLFLLQLRMLDIPQELLPSDETFLRFRNIKAYLTDGTEVDLGAQEVRIQVNDVSVATEEPVWAQGIKLFPNPVEDRLYWQFSDLKPKRYRLFNLQGQLLQTGNVVGNSLDVGRLPAGVYNLQLMHNGSTVARRIIKH